MDDRPYPEACREVWFWPRDSDDLRRWVALERYAFACALQAFDERRPPYFGRAGIEDWAAYFDALWHWAFAQTQRRLAERPPAC